MILELGHFAAALALSLSLLAVVGAVLGMRGRAAWLQVGRLALGGVFLLLTLSCASLVHAFVTRDFSVQYVAAHSNRLLPMFYTVAALWGGHEGSLLFWVWLLSGFTALAAVHHGRRHAHAFPPVMLVLALVLAGFLGMVLFLSSPFARLFPPPADGRDLNPLLQDPGMVFHPPFLYLGYVGFTIPFAFAMSALWRGRVDSEWILATRRWSLLAWSMLTLGILFGGYWAYYELGWGGYWGWDPVENASLMPWLTGTAFLHSVMVQEKRRMFKVWNLFLIILTFALSILGTFLVRSGIISSVHAFASDPYRGVYILGFLAVILTGSFGLLVSRADRLRSEHAMDSLLSRESAFLFNNLFFLVAALTVLVGTLYPLAVEALQGIRVSVGPPYYNKVFVPVMLAMLVLMGAAPLMAWRRASWSQMRRQFLKPVLGAAGIALAAGLLGIRSAYASLAVAVVAFVALATLQDVHRAVVARRRQQGGSYVGVLARLLVRNKRRYGGYAVHLGILLMVVGMLGSGGFQVEKGLLLQPGQAFPLGPYVVRFESLGETSGPNWRALEGVFTVWHGKERVAELRPQRRFYPRSESPTTEAAIDATLWRDVYLVIGEPVPGQGIAVKAYLNPLVQWIWIGGGVVALGGLWALFHRQPRMRRTEA